MSTQCTWHSPQWRGVQVLAVPPGASALVLFSYAIANHRPLCMLARFLPLSSHMVSFESVMIVLT